MNTGFDPVRIGAIPLATRRCMAGGLAAPTLCTGEIPGVPAQGALHAALA